MAFRNIRGVFALRPALHQLSYAKAFHGHLPKTAAGSLVAIVSLRSKATSLWGRLKMIRLVSGPLAAIFSLLLAGAVKPADAVPIQFGTQYFDFVSDPGVTWADAETAAAASTFDGVNGFLAVVTSAGENNFLNANFNSFQSFAGAWLGGLVNNSDTGIWQVGPLAGSAFSQGQASVGGAYVNWGGIEPNNAPSGMYMNLGILYAGINPGQWADAANAVPSAGDPIQGYLVEFDVPATVPEPASVVLLGTAMIFLGAMRLRARFSLRSPYGRRQ